MKLFDYDAIRAAVAAVLDGHVIQREGGWLFDYWAATEAACYRLNVSSASDLGNFVDGMIVDAVEERFTVALPDSRLAREKVGA